MERQLEAFAEQGAHHRLHLVFCGGGVGLGDDVIALRGQQGRPRDLRALHPVGPLDAGFDGDILHVQRSRQHGRAAVGLKLHPFGTGPNGGNGNAGGVGWPVAVFAARNVLNASNRIAGSLIISHNTRCRWRRFPTFWFLADDAWPAGPSKRHSRQRLSSCFICFSCAELLD